MVFPTPFPYGAAGATFRHLDRIGGTSSPSQGFQAGCHWLAQGWPGKGMVTSKPALSYSPIEWLVNGWLINYRWLVN